MVLSLFYRRISPLLHPLFILYRLTVLAGNFFEFEIIKGYIPRGFSTNRKNNINKKNMSPKQNFQKSEKKNDASSLRKSSANYQVELLLQNIKEKAGEVVRIAITARTVIELPAHLSHEEREARIANYIKLHKTKLL